MTDATDNPSFKLESVVLITGLGGSGKSTAVRALEDAGFYCVDNLPSALIEQLLETVVKEQISPRVALVMDMREQRFLQRAPAILERLKASKLPVRVLFLEADESQILQRYSQTRRTHPLDRGEGLRAAIAHEKQVFAPLRVLSDDIIDSSSLSPHTLRQRIADELGPEANTRTMRISVQSFGFKYGLPPEADMVLDVRFLPNPFFDPVLKPQTGLDEKCAAFVLGQPATAEFRRYTEAFLAFLLPHYQNEGKRYFTLAIGCTGGRHRSVALAEAIGKTLAERGSACDIRHRDITRDILTRGTA